MQRTVKKDIPLLMHVCVHAYIELLLILPISELLGYVQVFQVVVDGPLILLQQSVGVSQAVTGLSLHHLVPQLPGQLQRFPFERQTEE